MKKLLDTSKSLGNPKVKKSMAKGTRFATLTMHPDSKVCAFSTAAGCIDDCLKEAGLGGVYPSINQARQKRTDYWHSDRERFIAQLAEELTRFSRLCDKQDLLGVVRLNVMSDVLWERFNIPQSFPSLEFYDYTKTAKRFYTELPSNYRLMFSYSGAPEYRDSVKKFLDSGSDAPIAVVFRHKDFPSSFLGRPVINGDDSDWVNVNNRGVVVGLAAKGPAKYNDNGFVVDNDVIPTF